MTANLFNERFYSYREPAWHRLGVVSQEPKSATEAFIPFQYGVELWENAFVSPDKTQMVAANEYKAIVRTPVPDDPEYRIFGMVKDYKLVDPLTVCEVFDSVFPAVETLVVLGKGEELVLTYKGESFDVSGDPVETYVVLRSPYKPGISIQTYLTPVRVVCQNTLVMSWSRRSLAENIRHTEKAKAELIANLTAYKAILDGEITKTREAFELMVKKSLTEQAVQEFLNALLPLPEDEKERQTVISRRELIRELFDGAGTGMDLESCRGTAYGLYNAVVEYADYGTQMRGAPSNSLSELFGWRADLKAKAFALLNS